MCRSSTVSDLSRLELASVAYDPAHHAQYLTVNRTNFRTSQRPKVSRNEFRSFMLNAIDRLVLVHCFFLIFLSLLRAVVRPTLDLSVETT